MNPFRHLLLTAFAGLSLAARAQDASPTPPVQPPSSPAASPPTIVQPIPAPVPPPAVSPAAPSAAVPSAAPRTFTNRPAGAAQFPAFPVPRITPRATNPPTATAAPASPATIPQVPTVPPSGRPVTVRGAAGPAGVGATAPPVVPPPGGAAGAVGAGAAGAAGGAATPILPPDQNFGALAADATLPAGTLTRLQSMPLEQVFTIYAQITGRIVLRPNTLPAAAITLDASQHELTKAEAVQALDSVLTLNGVTMIPVGDKFVTAVPSNQAVQEAAQFTELKAGQLPEAGQYITKIVTLTNIAPSEMMPLIQGFAKTPNGIVPLDSSMTLVLRDYAANIKRMMEIIEKVDVKKEEDLKLEVIPIRYGTVDEIYETMSSLIGGGGGAAGGGTGTMGARRTGGATGFGGARGSSLGRGGMGGMGGYGGMGGTGGYGGMGGYGGSRYGGGYYPQQVATTPTQPGAVGSTTFQNRLQSVVSRMTGQQKEVQLLESAKIVPDRRSNSLIVYANKKDMQMITNMVAKVDVLLAQVLIEAIIMEVKLTGDLEYGVSAYLKDQSGNWGSQGFMNTGNILNAATNLANGTDNFTFVGRYKDDVTVVVRALASNGRGEILATPRIQTSHAMAASFSVGETVPYATGSYSYYGSASPATTYSQLPVITELSVTPYITPDGLVVMDVTQTIQDISGFKTFAGVGDLPITVERNAQATISVQTQDTIILGGYIRSSRSRSKSGVPVLKDIPLLGAAFRSTSDNKSRTEMVVFIKPTVLDSPRDAALLATREQDRMPGVRRMNADMAREMDKLQEKADRELDGKRKK